MLLALAEWDPAWALQLLRQLVLTIADSPREPDCPPSFLLALDRLLQLQPLTPDRPPPPAHRAVPELLPPLLHLTQRWLAHTEASVKLLYRAPGATGVPEMSVAATSWALFASVTLQQLLGFLAAEPEMQERLRRRVATSQKRMVKWMSEEARRRFCAAMKQSVEAMREHREVPLFVKQLHEKRGKEGLETRESLVGGIAESVARAKIGRKREEPEGTAAASTSLGFTEKDRNALPAQLEANRKSQEKRCAPHSEGVESPPKERRVDTNL